MDITSITISLSVDNLAKAAAWYEQVFGIQKHLQPAKGIVEFQVGSLLLQLFEGRQAVSDTALRLGVADLEKEHQRLYGLGIQTEAITDVPGVIRYFDFVDPFGNGLSFYTMYK